MINSGLNGIDEHTKPFTVGNVLPEKGFVHVFDDFSLTQILNELDTASDFISYLVAREDFLSAEKPVVISAGEEQLLAIYLTNTDVDGNHAFVLSTTGDPEVVFLDESFWDSMVSNPQYGRKKEADRVSYVWDRLIEHFISFGEHGERRSQDFEFAYRLMASEPRTRRRQLGHALQDLMISTPVEQRAVRVVFSSDVSEKVFVFLICPVQNGLTYAVDRKRRQEMLLAYCNVAKLRFNDSNYIIGIAIDPRDSDEVSADLIALDVSGWGEVDFERAQALQREAKILLDDKIRVRIGRTSEYPEHRKLPVKQAKNSNRAERNKENRKQMQRASRRRNRKKR